jgi:hypothetical protein
MVYIMIGSAVLSLLFVVFGAYVLVRNALTFSRTASRFQKLIEPQVFKIMHMVEVIQNRAPVVVEKSELLQRRVFLLSFTLEKMKILISAFQKAIEPINRARSYVGL